NHNFDRGQELGGGKHEQIVSLLVESKSLRVIAPPDQEVVRVSGEVVETEMPVGIDRESKHGACAGYAPGTAGSPSTQGPGRNGLGKLQRDGSSDQRPVSPSCAGEKD